jgi:cephalosporin hydroxylase
VKFKREMEDRLKAIEKNIEIKNAAQNFMNASITPQYSYNFAWMGRPIIQYPQDMIAMQELIWEVKPDLIIETGIAHGGSLIMNASLLSILDYCDALKAGELIDPSKPKRRVLGIDIDIRKHNRLSIEAHPMSNYIDMIEGSSIDLNIIEKVKAYAANYSRILISLDSNHTHDHVLAELNAYASLTSLDSYCIVFDTIVEDMSDDLAEDRPWSPGNNPKTAVWEFLKTHPEFEVNKSIEKKLLITVAPDGYLKRVF